MLLFCLLFFALLFNLLVDHNFATSCGMGLLHNSCIFYIVSRLTLQLFLKGDSAPLTANEEKEEVSIENEDKEDLSKPKAEKEIDPKGEHFVLCDYFSNLFHRN